MALTEYKSFCRRKPPHSSTHTRHPYTHKHTRILNTYAWPMLTDMVDQCLLKGLSKQEGLEMSFDLKQNGEMSQNGRPETALTKRFWRNGKPETALTKRCHRMAGLKQHSPTDVTEWQAWNSTHQEMSQNGRPETALTKSCHRMACLITVGLCLKVDWADPKQPQVSREVPSKLQHILVCGEVLCSPIQDDLPANCSISWWVERSGAALYRITY